ncbi:hypothetical protein PF001_g26979, partial [Phytophthora fragariae]
IIILVRLARFEALLCLRRCSATRIQATWRMGLANTLQRWTQLLQGSRTAGCSFIEELCTR